MPISICQFIWICLNFSHQVAHLYVFSHMDYIDKDNEQGTFFKVITRSCFWFVCNYFVIILLYFVILLLLFWIYWWLSSINSISSRVFLISTLLWFRQCSSVATNWLHTYFRHCFCVLPVCLFQQSIHFQVNFFTLQNLVGMFDVHDVRDDVV